MSKLKKNKNDQFSHLNNSLTQSQYNKLYDLCGKYVKNTDKCLDWGVGSGHFIKYLSKIYHNVYGFSIQPDLINVSKSIKKNIKSSKEVIKLPYDSNFFDCVFSIGVLEHVRECDGNEISSLIEINRILDDGGIFICYHFPNKYSWIEFICRTMKIGRPHRYKYSKNDIEPMLSKAGFAIIEYNRYGILFRNSMSKLPLSLTNNRIVVSLYNNVDNILSFIFNFFCQNHYFIAKKI